MARVELVGRRDSPSQAEPTSDASPPGGPGFRLALRSGALPPPYPPTQLKNSVNGFSEKYIVVYREIRIF